MSEPPKAPPASAGLEADLRLLLESVTDYAIFMLDPEGRVASWNTGAVNINGYTAAEIIGRHFSTFYLPEDIAAGKPEWELQQAIAHGRVEDDGWRLRKEGRRFWASVVITAVRDADGRLRGFAKVTRDRTQQRMAVERLRESEERFHLLVDAVTDYAIFMLDATGHVATWNAGAEKAKGYLASEIVGRHFSAFYTPEDRAAGKPERILETTRRTGRYEEEGWRVRKDGSRFWANVVLNTLRDTRGEIAGFAKITRDLTARRLAEETERTLALEQVARVTAEGAADRASEANRIKDEFLATVSHELRTPLNAIIGWTSILRRRSLEPELEKAVDVIDRNARAQVRIVDDILDVSRIITGKLRIEEKPVDLVAIVKDALEVIRPAVTAKQIALLFEHARPELRLVGDPDRLQQVVWNLLSNAAKFTDARGTIRVSLVQMDSQFVLTVTDNGRGIDPAFLPFVFDRFKQADASTTRRVGGLGLGLAIVRSLVELHGGSVSVESPGLGRGSTFRVVLPIRAVQPEAPREEPRATRRDDEPTGVLRALHGLQVLVVDDDEDARAIVSMVLSASGAAVQSAASADEGLARLRAFRPHVIVSDIGMPDEDGYSLIRRVRALDPDAGGRIPAIALTAYTRSEDRTKALAAGFTAHIGKPVEADDLVAAVATLAGLEPR